MTVRGYLEQGRNLAERIPYTVIALAARLAVADVFWRSGQTKVSGFSIREETFYLFREEYKVPLLPPDVAAYLSTVGEHVFPILLFLGLRVAAFGAWPFRDDDGHPVVCCARRLARAHSVVVVAHFDHCARAGGNFHRSSDLEPQIFVACVNAQRSGLGLGRTTKPPLSKAAAFPLG